MVWPRSGEWSGLGSVRSAQWSGQYLVSLANGGQSLFCQYPYFCLFGLANTHISVCSLWPIPIFRSVRSGQYPYFGLLGLANTIFLSARSAQYHFSVCSVWPIPTFWSGLRSGQGSDVGSARSGGWSGLGLENGLA